MVWSNILKNLFFGQETTELVVESPLFLSLSSLSSDASLLSLPLPSAFFPQAHDCNKNFVSSVFKIVGLQHVCAPVGKNKSSPMSAVDAGLASAACSNAVAKYPEGHLASLFDKAEIAFEEDARKLLSVASSPLSSPPVFPPPLPRLPLRNSRSKLARLSRLCSKVSSNPHPLSSSRESSLRPRPDRTPSKRTVDNTSLSTTARTYSLSLRRRIVQHFQNPTIKYPSLSHRNPTPTAVSTFLFAASRFSYGAK